MIEAGSRHSGDVCLHGQVSVEENSEVADNLDRLNNIGSNGQAPVGPRHLTEVRRRSIHSTSVFFVFSWRRLHAHQLEMAAIHSCMFDVIRRVPRLSTHVPLHVIGEQVVHHPLEFKNFLRILCVDDI